MLISCWANSWTALTWLHIPHEKSATMLSSFFTIPRATRVPSLGLRFALLFFFLSFWGLILSSIGVFGKACPSQMNPSSKMPPIAKGLWRGIFEQTEAWSQVFWRQKWCYLRNQQCFVTVRIRHMTTAVLDAGKRPRETGDPVRCKNTPFPR